MSVSVPKKKDAEWFNSSDFQVRVVQEISKTQLISWRLSMSGTKRTVLCIDDEPSFLRFYRQMLEDAGYEVVSYTDARAGLEFFASAQVDLAVLDYSMPRLGGAEVARTIRGMNPGLPIIMVSSWPECPRDAENWVNVYLMKVRDFDELPGSIERLLATQTDAA